ncbi:MAG TPA: DUF4194 domain-containing protein [Candidatus Paceibacterota bacterium]|nr:DUF4194 domain-containing protein [Verrucomicrobiota bacterium]HRY49001.1 DUF4194 domain-containing protein [Candidatus Paceibacterota bacterium]
MNSDINPPTPAPLLRLTDSDRVCLGEALQALLAHGSILGLESGDGVLYAWSRQNFDWLREMAALIGLAVSMEHESRLIQAVPERPALTLNLRQDVTIVLLALWYEYDTQVRDHGAAQVTMTVEQLNQLLKEKLLPDLKSQPSAGRMLEILRQAQRFNLIRFEPTQPFQQSRIEVLKTLPRVIQFNEIAEWTRTADLHKNPSAALSAVGENGGEVEDVEP